MVDLASSGSGVKAGERELLNAIYPLSDTTIERLVLYRQLLESWQAKTNLIASSTLPQFWTRHVADSLQVLALIIKRIKTTDQSNPVICDLGSGGGFPGLVIAIALEQEHRSGHVNLVESNAKKCAFLRSIARQTQAAATIFHQRIESDPTPVEEAQIITARALAPLDTLFSLTERFLTDDRIGLFHKGQDFSSEIKDCHGRWSFDLLNHQSQINENSAILEVSNVRKSN